MRTTENNIEKARAALININSEHVTYDDAVNEIERVGVHKMNLYYFVSSGCLSRVRRGEYIKTNLLTSLSAKQIIIKSLEHNKRKREKNKPAKFTTSYGTNYLVNEADAIKLLKSLGYKIMKQVNEYKEI